MIIVFFSKTGKNYFRVHRENYLPFTVRRRGKAGRITGLAKQVPRRLAISGHD
jgi:hypothetical protein